MAYKLFGGLVKISGNNWQAYVDKKSTSASGIIFADIVDTSKDGGVDHTGKYIFANGVEYKVQDADAFKAYEAAADASIDRLDTSVSALESWKTALALGVSNNVIQITGVDGSVTVEGSDYLAVSTADNKISLSINSSVQHATNETADASRLLTTVGYVQTAVANAKSDADKKIVDLSTYVHETVNASIDRLDVSVSALETATDSSFKAVDASLKDALKTVALTEAAVASNKATFTLTSTKESNATSSESFSVMADSYITISKTTDASVNIALHVVNTSLGIADASSVGDSSVTTAYAVKSYVADQLKDIVGALVFRGGVAQASDIPSSPKIGDVYVATAKFTFSDGGETRSVETGDMIIWNGTKWLVVERNLDGAVTTDGTLADSKVVVGAGNQKVKDSGYALGVDTSAAFNTPTANASTLATVAGTAAWVNQEIIDAVSELAVSAQGDSYVSASVDTTNNKKINVSTNIALMANAATGKLADSKDVSDAILAVNGSISFVAVTADKAVKLSTTINGHEHNVQIDSTDENLKVNVTDGKFVMDLSTATLADASSGATGLATAEDVHKELNSVELVVARSINKMAESVGLGSDLSTNADFVSTFQTRTVSQAVIDLSTDLAAANASLPGIISKAIDASIKLLDVSDSSAAGKFVVKVSETDGKIEVSHAGLKVNGITATSDAAGDVSVTISGANIQVGGSSVHKDKMISAAINDLSTAIDNITSDAVMSVTGDNVDPTTPTQFVGVSASEDGSHNVSLDSSLLIATNYPLTGTAPTATGLATDAYVKNAVQNALTWEEIA